MSSAAPPVAERSVGVDPPDAGPGPSARRRQLLRAGLLVATLVTGLAAVVVAALVPVAPVDATTSTVSWPAAGADPAAPASTTLFLVPYRPAELHAQVPCAALRAARDSPDATTVLSTTTSDTAPGLAVQSASGTVRLLSSGRAETLEVPAGDCTLRIDADGAGLRASVDGRRVLAHDGDPVPQVFAVRTDLTGDAARGLGLQARTPAWFANATTPEKSALITLQLQLAAVALGLLVALGALDARPTRGSPGWVARRWRAVRSPGTWCRAAIDAGVVVGLTWWSVVGPMTDDDGFAVTIARAAADGGPVGNYVRWFDAAEAPFATSQEILGLMLARGGDDPLTMRFPSLLAGIALWFLVTRGVLRRGLGGRAGTSVAVRLLTGLALAAWWLPFDLSARPEPFVAAGATGVLVLVLRAVHPDARQPLPTLGIAAGLAALTVTVAPSGLIVVVPFLLTAPRVVRALRGDARGAVGVARAVAAASAALGIAAVAVVVVFARQSWHGFVVATVVHGQFGPSQPWYAEWLRYEGLLGEDSWGSATKRVPVLLALVIVLPAVTLLARRGRAALGAAPSEAVVLLLAAPAGLIVLAVTPSKWSHHFGALAGFGAISLVAVVVALARAAWRPAGDPVLRAVGAVTALGVVAAAAAAFIGPNSWWGYSNAHVPWATSPVTPFAGAGWWLVVGAVAVALVALAVTAWRRLYAGEGDADDLVGTAGVAAPAVVAVLLVTTSVGVLVWSFAQAADPPPGGWSPGAQNLATARDPGGRAACTLEDRIVVLTTAGGAPLAAQDGAAPAELDGFTSQGGWKDPPPTRPGERDGDETTRDSRYAWGSRGAPGVGSLTSPWFVLPRPGPGQDLALGVAGRTDDGVEVTLEYGRSDERDVTSLASARVTDPPAPERGYRGYARDDEQARRQDRNADRSAWRTITVPGPTVPADADRVRLVARDDSTDENAWVALTGPRLVEPTPLRSYLAERGPVVVNWALAFALPCVDDLATVRDGLAAAPRALLMTPQAIPDPGEGGRILDDGDPGDLMPERWIAGPDGLVTSTDVGASFAGVDQTADLDEVDTRLVGEPARVWGRLLLPDYGDLDRDAYDVRTSTERIAGTAGDPPPAFDPRPDPDR